MKRKEKIYQIQYIISNEKTIVHGGKREKVIKEWEEVSLLTAEEVMKYLKLGKGKDKEKYKDIEMVEVKLLDWCGNLMVSKIIEDEENKQEKEL